VSTPKDCGPAFPVFPHEAHAHVEPGMSLRDWFAGMAIARFESGNDEECAQWCYELADAMIAARSKQEAQP